MRLALCLTAVLGLATPAFAQAPTAVAKNDQFATLIEGCEQAKKCLGDAKGCTALDSHTCVAYVEGIQHVMAIACNQRKTDKGVPKAMTMKQASRVQLVDALIKYAKDHPKETVEHRARVTIRAFAKELPCEN